MSATNRGGERDKLDRYYTPDYLANQLVGLLDREELHTVVEPSVGGGAFVNAVYKHTKGKATVVGVDLDPEADGKDIVDEFYLGKFEEVAHLVENDYPSVTAVVGNPPFYAAEVQVRQSLEMAPVVGFILRLSFLATMRRAKFWSETPLSEVYVLCRRPSFTGGGTDAADYGFFVWRHGHVGAPSIRWIMPDGRVHPETP
ncbi:MAG: hypothetical protein P1V36_00335 [Planctomycetota bacterium]|nr:hypothetical protein [Planctomycetota bacterium]